MKALGTGWGQGVSWQQIEILNADSGAPVVRLSGRAAERMAELGGTRLLVSISHSEHYAVAQAVIEGEG
jgi:holo-[acyl-carrier protein] synthase